jgi:hypothetical protein
VGNRVGRSGEAPGEELGKARKNAAARNSNTRRIIGLLIYLLVSWKEFHWVASLYKASGWLNKTSPCPLAIGAKLAQKDHYLKFERY